MNPPPSCRTCRWWTYSTGIVDGKREQWPSCGQQSNLFSPRGDTLCTLYEREPGSDDE